MPEKCPHCYRISGTWKYDPILLPDGSSYKWKTDTELEFVSDISKRFYKGTYQISYPEVKELQDYLKSLETDYGIIPATEFSPLNTSGKFQITGKHIKEMRDSVEKLLNEFGVTKTEYFNYDALDNHIIHPNGDKLNWTDPITEATDLEKFQVKYIHIEDLRRYLKATSMIWTSGVYITTPPPFNAAVFKDQDTMEFFKLVNNSWGTLDWVGYNLCTDFNYVYCGHAKSRTIRKYPKSGIGVITSGNLPYLEGFTTGSIGITVDESFVWVLAANYYPGAYYKNFRIAKFNKETMVLIEDYWYTLNTTYTSGVADGLAIVCDRDNIYALNHIDPDTTDSVIIRINKETKAVIKKDFAEAPTVWATGLGIDNDYLYVGTYPTITPKIYTIDKDLTSWQVLIDDASIPRYRGQTVTVGKDNIYVFGCRSDPDGVLRVYTKLGTFLYETNTINSYPLYYRGGVFYSYLGSMYAEYQWKQVLI